MTEQSTEPLNSSNKASVVEEGTSGSNVTQPQRLEALLVDSSESSSATSNYDITVKQQKSATCLWQLASLLFLVLLALGLGFVLFELYSHSEPKPIQPEPSVELKQSVPPRPIPEKMSETARETENDTAEEVVPVGKDQGSHLPAVEIVVEKTHYTVIVGPFINDASLNKADAILSELGLQAQKESGRGMVPMIRLEEGIYPPDQAKKRLIDLRKVIKSAFLLPNGTQKALYAGSFFEEERALQLQSRLKKKHIDVKLVQTEIAMDGTLLIALKADQQTAGEFAQHIRERGLNVQVTQPR